MTRSGACISLLLGLAVGAGWWSSRPVPIEAGAVDLIEEFPDAAKRTTMAGLHEAFAITHVDINGRRLRAIQALPFSRITWSLAVPRPATLRTEVAIRPESWLVPGDGAVFRIGVSDGSRYEEHFRQRINPYYVETDRRWFPVEIDLTPYAGRRIELIFNTEPNFNAVYDAAVWGAPRVAFR